MLTADEGGIRMDALELDDTGVIGVDNEIINNDTAVEAGVRADDEVENIKLEDEGSPAIRC